MTGEEFVGRFLGSKMVDSTIIKYRKMHEMLPEAAVRQKMTVDGLSQEYIEYFFHSHLAHLKGSSESSVSKAPAMVTTVKVNYEAYAKMLKILPEHVIRQKMMLQGVTKEDIDYFFDSMVSKLMHIENSPPVEIFSGESTSFVTVGSLMASYGRFVNMSTILPDQVMRQKLKVREKMGDEEINYYFAYILPNWKEPTRLIPPPASSQLSKNAFNPHLIAKYVTIVNTLPDVVVKQKLRVEEGLSQQFIDRFLLIVASRVVVLSGNVLGRVGEVKEEPAAKKLKV